MSRNQIFIIAGSIIVVLLIALLIFLQFIQGDVADTRTNAYYINIEHCPAMEKKEQIDNELAEILSSTELKENSLFLVPIVTINTKNKLSTPAIGMNYIRYLINPVMYVYDNNRKEDVEVFFKSHAQSNATYLALKAEALKISNIEPKVSLDVENDSTQFFIDLNQKVDSDPTKKIWNSLKSLRVHLNMLVKQGKIKAGTNVSIYYRCGPLSGMLDDDKDGVMNSNDNCRDKAGKKEYEGCPDTDGDKVHDGIDQCPDKLGDKECLGCKCPPPSPCPGDADDDRDGFCNKSDKCPKEFGNYMGCPDNDKDGILNADDKCADKPGEKECFGCPCPPLDSDGDGVPDKDDKCPKEFGKTPDGCQLKVGIEHIDTKEEGHFLITGVNFSQIKAKLVITQRNNKKIELDFKSLRLPIDDPDSKNIFQFFTEGADFVAEVKVYDLNNNLLKTQKFSELSYVCFTQYKCGFKKF